MAAFVRRFTDFPSVEVLTEIEAINIIDKTPEFPVSGVGSGTLLLVGEFEDGPYEEPTEVFGSQDLAQRFGSFGYTYGTTRYANPSARRHAGELWNGNAFLKLKFLRPRRLVVCRVDTSVGEVIFQPRACVVGGKGPFRLADGDVLTVTTSQGGPSSSAAIAAAVATVAGNTVATGGGFPTGFVGGEQIRITIDDRTAVTVTFAAGDQTAQDVADRINEALGYTAAVVNAGEVDLSGQVAGTDGQIILADVTAGTLAQIGHTAATTAGTGDVGNIDAATASEVANFINGDATLTASAVEANVDQDGFLRICDSTVGVGTVQVASTSMGAKLGIATEDLDTTFTAGVHDRGEIPAGTRVRDASDNEWVTTQTLVVEEGTSTSPNVGPHKARIRPALDDGTAAGAAANAIDTLVDQPSFHDFVVDNPQAVDAALNESQMDVAYETAFDATIDLTTPAREVNHSLCARRTAAIVRKGRDNAEQASEQGHFGRKFHTRAPLGMSFADAITDVASFRSDRVFYTYPGWRVRIPEIAERGTDGGLGFTSDGLITVGADGPLAYINAKLNPEENPGQQTGLIENFFEVEKVDIKLGIEQYTALKAAGICAPRRDRTAGSIYQSEQTTSLVEGRKTQKRRKMADFIQDSYGEFLLKYAKKLASESRKDAVRADIEQFLGGLRSEENEDLQRIAAFSVDDETANTPEFQARGIHVVITKVRLLPSLDALTIQTEIGEGVVISTEL